MVGVHLAIALTHGGPVAVPDVPAYLSVPQWVVGVGQSTTGLQFHPGYGLLLIPAAVVVQTDGQALHTLALVLNAIAAGAVVVVAVRLARRLLSKQTALIAVALLAALHPSVTAASRIAWPETLLVLLTLSIGLCLAATWSLHSDQAQTQPNRPVRMRLGAVGLLTGLAFSLHPRALVLTLALCAVVATQRWVRKSWLSVAVGLSLGWLLSITALTVTSTWPSERVGAAASGGNGLEPIATAAGQLITLAAGTAGLALVGLVIGVWLTVTALRATGRFALKPRHCANSDGTAANDSYGDNTAANDSYGDGTAANDSYGDGTAAVAVFFATGAIAVIVLGGWVLAGSTRADTFLYGRYVDPWAIPLAIVAICSLRSSRNNDQSISKTSPVLASTVLESPMLIGAGPAVDTARSQPQNNAASSPPSLLWGLWGISVFAMTIAVIAVLAATQTGVIASGRRIMTLSLSPIWSLTGTASVRNAAPLASILALAGVTLFVFSQRCLFHCRLSHCRPPRWRLFQCRVAQAGLAVLALALFSFATVSNHRHLADVGKISAGQTETAELAVELAALDGIKCLAHEADTVPSYARWLYQLQAPQLSHESVSFMSGQTACGPLVIARASIQQRCPGAEQLARERFGAWGLWRLHETSACLLEAVPRAQ